jgi:hypothetical protein
MVQSIMKTPEENMTINIILRGKAAFSLKRSGIGIKRIPRSDLIRYHESRSYRGELLMDRVTYSTFNVAITT